MPVLTIKRGGRIKSLPNLLTHVRRARDICPTGAIWLRGLANSNYDLLPTIGRKHAFAGRSVQFDRQLEQRMMHRFRRYAYGMVGRELTAWEALFVARHHGFPVRLLDWTSNPLAALYFACEFAGETPPSDGKIWILIPSADLSRSIDPFRKEDDPFEIKGVRVVYPMVISPRITAQSGYFTIQDDPWKPLDQLTPTDYDEANMDILELREFVVPAEDRARRMKELSDLDVTRRTLFPDLDGLARGLLDTEILRGPGRR